MSTIIRTATTSNGSGRPQVIAKGGGKQRTVSVDLSKSSAWNHGNAAGVLGLVLGLEWHDGIGHDSNDSGTKHGFSF